MFDRTVGGQDSIGRKIAGFGTKNGGILLIGQQDFKHGGKVVGIAEEDFHTQFRNAIANIRPAPLTQQKIIDHAGTKLALIRVQDVGTLRPCAYNGDYYERKGDSTPKLGPEEIKRYHVLYGASNPEDMPTHATKLDLDQVELELYGQRLKKKESTILESVTNEKEYLTVRGVIILSKKPDDHLEGAFAEVQRYDNVMGTGPTPIGSPVKISRPARQMILELAGIIEQNLPVSREYQGAQMSQSPAIPSSVIREAVTNAVAHRNYRSHEHIRVRIFSDGFDISNPAAITQKMWEDIQNAQTTYHPNEGIYTFLNPALLYEGRGEGIWKIRTELERLGKTAPEFKVIGETPSTFYARISLNPAKKRDVRMQKLEAMMAKKKIITSSDVMKELKISRVTAISLLEKMAEKGRLEHQGSTRSSRYQVK
ncbi:hypothetical protein HYV43_04775 [Candidatus Micrarchaeota archaeon]|nr:hypothetical protein [Candidatus Micrarchaeota archaeon]